MSKRPILDMTGAPSWARQCDVPSAGDIYRKAGGNKPGFWLIVAVSDNAAHALSLDCNGCINGTTSYRAGYFSENAHRRVGRTRITIEQPDWIKPDMSICCSILHPPYYHPGDVA